MEAWTYLPVPISTRVPPGYRLAPYRTEGCTRVERSAVHSMLMVGLPNDLWLTGGGACQLPTCLTKRFYLIGIKAILALIQVKIRFGLHVTLSCWQIYATGRMNPVSGGSVAVAERDEIISNPPGANAASHRTDHVGVS